ncbi:MAG: hypothetical protein IJK26_02900 [Clostridia bacterium]|nr:hypothetical protein [Clostridia bacterium]
METKKQKIERLKHQIRINNQGRKAMKHSIYAMKLRDYNKEIIQEIKELEQEEQC